MEKDFDLFFQQNEARVHYQIHRLHIPKQYYGEFYAEGIFSLWQAYKAYDGIENNLGTYVNYRIRYRLIDLIRKKERDAKLLEISQQEEASKLCDGNWSRATGLPVYDKKGVVIGEASEAFWKSIQDRLSVRQWKWIEYIVLAELSIQEVAEIEGVSVEAVKSWGKEVRKKLRMEGVRAELEKLL